MLINSAKMSSSECLKVACMLENVKYSLNLRIVSREAIQGDKKQPSLCDG